jgi:homogentisate 1,2-dioxygenase
MIERVVAGKVPAKHHIAFRKSDGSLYHEECLTRHGFSGAYTILYHERRPHTQRIDRVEGRGFRPPVRAAVDRERPLAKRHYKTQQMEPTGGAPVDARVPLLFNGDVVLSMMHPDRPDDVYFVNADGDDLYYIHRGGGVLRSLLGDLRFEEKDYVYVPKGLLHRFVPTAGMDQHWLSMECLGGMGLLSQWRNDVGQLTMDAPYSHRDFRAPELQGPMDENIRTSLVKREQRFFGYRYEHSPLDVVGWDGACYPFVFPILKFQPRAGLVHLPPTWHGTFAARGALICSFVPRVVDFHPESIPCPYPHSSVDCDEFIFYCHGNFTSRRGIDAGSVSHHPYGIPHGPHPGAYEKSIGARTTDELAVMLDTYQPLHPTDAALAIEDPGYHDSFIA